MNLRYDPVINKLQLAVACYQTVSAAVAAEPLPLLTFSLVTTSQASWQLPHHAPARFSSVVLAATLAGAAKLLQKLTQFKVKYAEARAKQRPDLQEVYDKKIQGLKAAGG